jgi:hypothetical protein
MRDPTALEQAVVQTVRYFHIFDMPVTAMQIWRNLLVPSAPEARAEVVSASLPHVQRLLATSAWLTSQLGHRWGYFYLRGEGASVDERLRRHVIAQHKWRVVQWLATCIGVVPFVRMIGVTGSLALNNTKQDSDFDFLLVVRGGRIWTARLLLLLLTQLLGKRRKYWNDKAPDKACLNHYLADTALTISPQNQTLYTAMLYARLVVLRGEAVFDRFERANRQWRDRWMVCRQAPKLQSVYTCRQGGASRWLQRFWESWLLEPVGDVVERIAEYVQRKAATRHARPEREGRVVLTHEELAFHPDSKAALVEAWSSHHGIKI